jgi:hypothetical protein
MPEKRALGFGRHEVSTAAVGEPDAVKPPPMMDDAAAAALLPDRPVRGH